MSKTKKTTGKPAKAVSEFKQIRAGTDRAKALKLMDGTRTVGQIAKAIKGDEQKVLTIAFCLYRDCGIGYRVDDDRKIVAIYPRKKSFKDAMKAAE
jgi:hypothetical protein